MRITKDRKETTIHFDEKNPMIDVFTCNADLKRRMRAFAKKYPDCCRILEDDDGFGGMRFDIEKGRLSFRLTAPYNDARRRQMKEYSEKHGTIAFVNGRKEN